MLALSLCTGSNVDLGAIAVVDLSQPQHSRLEILFKSGHLKVVTGEGIEKDAVKLDDAQREHYLTFGGSQEPKVNLTLPIRTGIRRPAF